MDLTNPPSLAEVLYAAVRGRSSDFRDGAGPAFSPCLTGARTRQWPKEWATLLTLGHSGGAVPESHRSSLFVDPSTEAADHHAPL